MLATYELVLGENFKVRKAGDFHMFAKRLEALAGAIREDLKGGHLLNTFYSEKLHGLNIGEGAHFIDESPEEHERRTAEQDYEEAMLGENLMKDADVILLQAYQEMKRLTELYTAAGDSKYHVTEDELWYLPGYSAALKGTVKPWRASLNQMVRDMRVRGVSGPDLIPGVYAQVALRVENMLRDAGALDPLKHMYPSEIQEEYNRQQQEFYGGDLEDHFGDSSYDHWVAGREFERKYQASSNGRG
jgi:hypothetical protein